MGAGSAAGGGAAGAAGSGGAEKAAGMAAENPAFDQGLRRMRAGKIGKVGALEK